MLPPDNQVLIRYSVLPKRSGCPISLRPGGRFAQNRKSRPLSGFCRFDSSARSCVKPPAFSFYREPAWQALPDLPCVRRAGTAAPALRSRAPVLPVIRPAATKPYKRQKHRPDRSIILQIRSGLLELKEPACSMRPLSSILPVLLLCFRRGINPCAISRSAVPRFQCLCRFLPEHRQAAPDRPFFGWSSGCRPTLFQQYGERAANRRR